MMKTRILVTALLASMLSASAIYAQRVERDLHFGYPVINCEGMSPSAYTTAIKDNRETALKTAAANATVSKRFVVQTADSSVWSDWSKAFTVCSSLGSNWRLPTQREWMLMWVLKVELNSAHGFTKLSEWDYWAATEHNSTDSWIIDIRNGFTRPSSKGTLCRVRCVLEI